MLEIFLSFIWLLIGIIAIGKGSDWFTDALIPMARRLGTSRVSIGLILVSVSVSLPEILVAVDGVLRGHVELSFGVTIGSIVCNIGLMTGLSALVRPLQVSTVIILRDGIFSIIVPLLVFAVGAAGRITRLEGIVFFLLFIPYLINVFLQEKEEPEPKEERLKEIEVELELLGFNFGKIRSPWIAFIVGLGLLLVGAQVFTNQLITLSRLFHINELLMGMTIGAIGPSIPNIMAAYHATKRGMTDVAVSETLGSNVFTLLVTLGVLAILSPITISQRNLFFDIPAVFGMSVLLFVFMLTGKVISRKEGVMLILGYVLFVVMQFFLASG
ncbi:MAG TPA: hypothetical protein DD723_04190 [Candidatus Omnitrophica bacterium]|nr:MAG: hypothetical protein A2Z81_02860 [Omnitrophica WOR_2 bacterium GWA2_45_18]HBR14731.1 hypothetical protein [Candidatus Omnitrophota bacterium]